MFISNLFLYFFFLLPSSILLPEKSMASHSSTLAWKIPWKEEPGRLQSMESLSRTRLSITFTFRFHALEKAMAAHSSVLAWRIPGTVKLGGLLSMGSHRVGHDWSDLAAAAAFFCIDTPFLFIHSLQWWLFMVFSLYLTGENKAVWACARLTADLKLFFFLGKYQGMGGWVIWSEYL